MYYYYHIYIYIKRFIINYIHLERDEILTVTRHPPEPPKFLLRMEARAKARRKRVKLAEEIRRQKLEEQKRKEEAARMEEEQKKRRLQQEVRLYNRSKYINVILSVINTYFTS